MVMPKDQIQQWSLSFDNIIKQKSRKRQQEILIKKTTKCRLVQVLSFDILLVQARWRKLMAKKQKDEEHSYVFIDPSFPRFGHLRPRSCVYHLPIKRTFLSLDH